MAEVGTGRRIAHAAVEAAIEAIVATTLRPKTDSMLRAFLGFKAIHRDGYKAGVDGSDLKRVVHELFTVLPTPGGVPEEKFSGTLALRGSQGQPLWLRNDSYRGSFQDYVGPESPGRAMFEDEDWREEMREGAVDVVVETLGGARYSWPPREALAAIALRNDSLDPALGGDAIDELARARFGVSAEEWKKVTSSRALGVGFFEGDPWDSAKLATELCPPGVEKAKESEAQIEELPAHLRAQVEKVRSALDEHGHRAIVALAGVPGTSKSYTARIAAKTFASEGCLREIQFSPGYTYEEFIEGPRYGERMEVEIEPGAFLELNERALEDPGHQYVLLIEELTRADVPRVFGELLTYVEYRDEQDTFTTMYKRDRTVRIAPNIAIIATYNPTDRSAVNVDAALVRRMRVIDFPPSTLLLEEILSDNGVDLAVIAKLISMFEACREQAGEDRFDEAMPFGHAVFATVEDEKDLHDLWHEQLKRILVRPHTPRNEFYDTIVEHYPWIRPDETVVGGSDQTPLGEE
jgi:5-methylcytosine-specific restriction protein B